MSFEGKSGVFWVENGLGRTMLREGRAHGKLKGHEEGKGHGEFGEPAVCGKQRV